MWDHPLMNILSGNELARGPCLRSEACPQHELVFAEPGTDGRWCRRSSEAVGMFRPADTGDSVQHPILTALDGGAEDQKVTGEMVLAGIGEILSRLLPDVPVDDPYRAALVSLAAASGCRPRAQRPRLAGQRAPRGSR